MLVAHGPSWAEGAVPAAMVCVPGTNWWIPAAVILLGFWKQDAGFHGSLLQMLWLL